MCIMILKDLLLCDIIKMLFKHYVIIISLWNYNVEDYRRN